MLELLVDDEGVEAHATESGDNHDVARAVEIGVDDLRRVAGKHFLVHDQGGEARQVGVFGGGRHREDAREVLLQVRLHVDQADAADLLDDRDVVGRSHLPAIGEAALEAIVVRGIVAGRDDHAGVGAEMTDREAQLRRGARVGKQVGFAAQLRPGRGQQLREMAGEMADVMGHHEARGGRLGGDLAPEAEAGAQDVEVVQAGGPDRGPDRQAGGIEFVRGADPADGAATHPPRAEGDPLVETVFELSPSPLGDQVGQGLHRGRGQRPRFEPTGCIGQGGSGKLALGFGRLEGGKDGVGSAHDPPVLASGGWAQARSNGGGGGG